MMGLPIFYTSDSDVDENSGFVSIIGDDARHLAKSLRVKTGETIQVSNGKGGIYGLEITEINTAAVRGMITGFNIEAVESPEIVVLQALIKPKYMDVAVSRCAECGVSKLFFYTAPRTLNGLKHEPVRIERWNKIAIESSKSARRPRPLKIEGPVEWPCADILQAHPLNIILWEDEKRGSLKSVLPKQPPGSLGIIIGPEGGFSENDVDLLKSLDARTAGLGRLNLKSQSAGSYASMLVRYEYGLLDGSGVPDER